MELFKIENLSFTYPNEASPAVENISLTVNRGDFVTICGRSGCGKTTLLRLLKPALAPFGTVSGQVFFEGKPLDSLSQTEQTEKIGFVLQSPESQLVTDKVWHELAFGLESLGIPSGEIRSRVAETAAFFGIEDRFHAKTSDLSGGQKQLLNLASVSAMHPSVLILDEPTGQLDPIAASEFLRALEKINRELGTTVILSEHRLEEALPLSTKTVVMDKGRVIACSTPQEIGKYLLQNEHPMFDALPAPMRIYGATETDGRFPVTVRDGRIWLEKYTKDNNITNCCIPKSPDYAPSPSTAIELKEVCFRYKKNSPDIINSLSLKIQKGEHFALLGGNGVGKTTILSLISGLNKPYSGTVLIKGKKLSQIRNPYQGILGVLPQNPQSLFAKKTVYLELWEMLDTSNAEKEQKIYEISRLCNISHLLDRHPYDLSGGEQQRTALAKILLLSPEILLLDEPTKGMDSEFKKEFAQIIKSLTNRGVTVVTVSHDIEFCAEHASRCAIVFDGRIASSGTPREFFSGNRFYTTSTHRMAADCLSDAILPKDVILACGGKEKTFNTQKNAPCETDICPKSTSQKPAFSKKISPPRLVLGIIFGVLFLLTFLTQFGMPDFLKVSSFVPTGSLGHQLLTLALAGGALLCFVPKKHYTPLNADLTDRRKKSPVHTIFTLAFILIAIPLTVLGGWFFLDDKKYYLISLLVILETIIPFFVSFEEKKPSARKIVLICVLCAISIVGRLAFSAVPQFKPMVAIIIISGVCFGGETGFLVGATTGFVSNFFFGQGPWTPWQMFALGIVGFLSGVLFRRGLLKRTRIALCIFGFLSTLLVYGIIMNVSSLILWQPEPTLEMLVSSIALGIPYDLIHGASTLFFLWFLAEPMLDKLERIRTKYGIF